MLSVIEGLYAVFASQNSFFNCFCRIALIFLHVLSSQDTELNGSLPPGPQIKGGSPDLVDFQGLPHAWPFSSESLITDCHGNCLRVWVTLPGRGPTPNLPGLAVARLPLKAQWLPPTVLPSRLLVSSF